MTRPEIPLEDICDAITRWPALTRAPAAILVALAAAPGRFIGYQMLREALEAETGNRATEDSVRSAVKRLRKAVGATATIHCASGVGYRLIWARE